MTNFLKIKHYLNLMRIDKPVGVWLLYWPCLWGLGAAAAIHPSELGWDKYAFFAAIFFIGATLMRGAGCAYNDWIDRDIDALVERTKLRPIASGAIAPPRALTFAAFLCAISSVLLFFLPPPAQIWAVTAIIPVLIYPIMKRLTYWPQIFLGIAFNWGVWVGYAAWSGSVDATAFVLYLAAFFWTIAYDTIYALQDIEDDIKIGVKSSAIAVRGKWKRWLAAWYGIALGLLGIIGIWHSFSAVYFVALFVVLCHFFWQIWALRPDDGANALHIFKSNIWLGGAVAAAFLIEYGQVL